MASILVIDSGVGGLSVCESILKRLPDVQIIYFADDAYFPYGELEESKLEQRLIQVVTQMLMHHNPDLVVLACNTASTLLLPELRQRFDLPFVGVVPAIKPAAALSQSRHIALLATPATVRRPYIDELVDEFASACRVTRVGSTELVQEAEHFLAGQSVDMQRLKEALAPIKVAESDNSVPVDVLVLGCTHFPLIRTHIQEALPEVTLIDSGEAIARRVEYVLSANEKKFAMSTEVEHPTQVETAQTHQVYFSHLIPNEEVLSHALERLGIHRYQLHCFSASID